MSRDGSIELEWADGTHRFRLGWGELAELQEKCDAGPYVVVQRLLDGTWRVQDLREVVRLGLIGGGMTPADSLKLVRLYVEARPPMESVAVAQAALMAAVIGAPDERPKKERAPGRARGSTASRTANSGSERSTAQAHA